MNALERPFSFAVVSDTHFVRREFGKTTDRDTNQLDPDAFVENVTYALAPMMDTLRELDPDILFITGDLVEPSIGKNPKEDLEAALAFFSTCEIPIVYARGNLDNAEAFHKLVLPQVASALDFEIAQTYYTFRIDGCLFIILDTADWSEQQRVWVEKTLQDASSLDTEHIFIFGHHPVWSVARAFFMPLDFSKDMVRLLEDFDVDGYFCGHTHNQSVVWHRTQGLPVFQFMGAMIGVSDEPPLALNQVLSFLPDKDDLLAYWPGYLENTAPGWYMVSVTDQEVVAEWHHLNRGAEAVFAWETPGDLLDFWMMEQVSPSKLISTDLGRIRRGFLRFCAWDGMENMKASLNGILIGELPVRDGFAPARLELPEQILRTLQMENRLEIRAPEACQSTLGNLMLEVMLPGGRYVRTPPNAALFSWTDKWADWPQRHLKQLAADDALKTMLIFE